MAETADSSVADGVTDGVGVAVATSVGIGVAVAVSSGGGGGEVGAGERRMA